MYFFTKFTYNEYIEPNFLSYVVLRFFASDLTKGLLEQLGLNEKNLEMTGLWQINE